MLAVIWTVDPQLGLVAIAITPILSGDHQRYRRIVRPRYRHVKQVESLAWQPSRSSSRRSAR